MEFFSKLKIFNKNLKFWDVKIIVRNIYDGELLSWTFELIFFHYYIFIKIYFLYFTKGVKSSDTVRIYF